MSTRIAIINAYSSANQIAPELATKWGIDCVHVQSQAELLDLHKPTFRPGDFVENLVFEGDCTAIADRLKALGVSQVIAGSEYGVEVAEAIAQAFGVPTNDPATTDHRRNKFAMVEALQQAGVPSARQRLCHSRADAVAFAQEEGARVVIKPLNSALNDGVSFCDTPDQAGEAFDAVVGRNTLYGDKIDAVVAQSYLNGHEYLINTMSRDGVHHVAEIWQTSHIALNGVHNLLDGAFMMPARGDVQDEIVSYGFKCLDALGIKNSPSHLEIRMTTNGPRLVEVGARLSGGPLARIARFGLAESQLDWLARAYADIDEFKRMAGTPYVLEQTVAIICLIARKTGTVRGFPGVEKLKQLETYREIIEVLKPGDRISPTINDVTQPMLVVLVHPDGAAVQRDSRTVRALDDESFYDIVS